MTADRTNDATETKKAEYKKIDFCLVIKNKMMQLYNSRGMTKRGQEKNELMC